MRIRNIKINVFLNEEEKWLLLKKCNKARLSQSDFIRKLMVEQTINLETKYDFKNLNDAEITSFVLTRLLENNHINLNADKSKITNQEHINGLLDSHYDFLQGKINKEVKDMYFECVTEYED